MTPLELRAARGLLGLSVAEAAEHVGGVSSQSWESFEKGDRPIKADIVAKINALIERRREILKEVQQKMLHKEADLKQIAVIYYESPEYCNGVLDWRFRQALARTLAFDYGAKLVQFDVKNYFEWLALGNNEDNEAHRAMWAAQQ